MGLYKMLMMTMRRKSRSHLIKALRAHCLRTTLFQPARKPLIYAHPAAQLCCCLPMFIISSSRSLFPEAHASGRFTLRDTSSRTFGSTAKQCSTSETRLINCNSADRVLVPLTSVLLIVQGTSSAHKVSINSGMFWPRAAQPNWLRRESTIPPKMITVTGLSFFELIKTVIFVI